MNQGEAVHPLPISRTYFVGSIKLGRFEEWTFGNLPGQSELYSQDKEIEATS